MKPDEAIKLLRAIGPATDNKQLRAQLEVPAKTVVAAYNHSESNLGQRLTALNYYETMLDASIALIEEVRAFIHSERAATEAKIKEQG